MAQPQCYYHPDKRGTASCPTCNQRICDRCRLQGNSLRCGTCQSNFQKGGEDPGGKRERVQCANHAGVPTDTRCVTCRKPYCAACLNGASKCFNCALAAPKPAASPGKRGKGAATKKDGKGTGKLAAKGAGKAKGKPNLPWPAIRSRGAHFVYGGVLAGLLVAGLVAMLLLKPGKPPKPYKVTGPMKVAIVGPSDTRPLSGPQVIKLQVASPNEIERVELTVDGKYWDKLKQPPFQSDWPTSLLTNGKHTIVAKAVYKDKRAVSAKRVVRTLNRR
jgi:Bacterial Ig domain